MVWCGREMLHKSEMCRQCPLDTNEMCNICHEYINHCKTNHCPRIHDTSKNNKIISLLLIYRKKVKDLLILCSFIVKSRIIEVKPVVLELLKWTSH